jgi:protein TonB
VPPAYPPRAQENQVEGYVDFDFTIQKDGTVGHPQVITEMPEAYGFADAALDVFSKWKFSPELVEGAPVPAPAKIRVSFRLAR